ncbi:MAG: hypothetical protein AAF483_07520 [Planctomycetota bacterium]
MQQRTEALLSCASSSFILRRASGAFHGYPAWYDVAELVKSLGHFVAGCFVIDWGGVLLAFATATEVESRDEVHYEMLAINDGDLKLHN